MIENQIIVKNLTKNFYFFNRDYKILKWLFNKKGYESVKTVLDDISFSVKKGETLGIIGSNGAGKSTLMKIIAGITFPSSGEAQTDGTVGSLINLGAGFNPDYTGRKNIYYKGTLLGMSKTEIDSIIDDIMEFIELGEYFDMPLRMYSSGMAARLGFALAVFSDPDILIIDEVFAVGDRYFQNKSQAKTIELFKAGKSIIFSSHSEELIKEFCQRVIYLKDGKIAYDGKVDEGILRYNQDIKNKK